MPHGLAFPFWDPLALRLHLGHNTPLTILRVTVSLSVSPSGSLAVLPRTACGHVLGTQECSYRTVATGLGANKRESPPRCGGRCLADSEPHGCVIFCVLCFVESRCVVFRGATRLQGNSPDSESQTAYPGNLAVSLYLCCDLGRVACPLCPSFFICKMG